MTLKTFFPKIVKAMLPFAPVVGVVSTCLLVASAVAQVADPILNAGIGLQVSCDNCFFLFINNNKLKYAHTDSHPPSPSRRGRRRLLAA
jgi:hypothetical protein